MPKIFQTVKKIFAAGGSGAGFIASVVSPALTFVYRFTLTAAQKNVGIALSERHAVRTEQQNPAVAVSLTGATGTGRVDTNPAVAMSQSPSVVASSSVLKQLAFAFTEGMRAAMAANHQKNVGLAVTLNGASGTGRVDTNPGLSMSSQVLTDGNLPQKKPAITHKISSLTCTILVGGNAVTETAVGGRTDWANDANAIDGTNGIHNGVVATLAGAGLSGARGGQLELSYPDHFFKERMRITSAKLHFYGAVASTVLNNADVALKWDSGSGVFTTLETITGNADYSVTPKTHDVTTSFNGWAGFNALRTAVSGSPASLESWTVTCDAVELEIQAEYKFVEDTSGNLRDGAIIGRVLPTVIASPFGAAFGNAIEFDGVDREDASSRMQSPNISTAGVTACTLEVAFRKDRNATEIIAAWNDYTPPNLNGLQIVNNSGFVQFQVFIAGVFTVGINSLASMANGNHVIRVCWDGTTYYLFLDGVLQGTFTSSSFPSVPMKVWAGGIDWKAGVPAAWPYAFDGAIDRVRLSNVCRSTSNYTVETAPFVADANTLLLWDMGAILP